VTVRPNSCGNYFTATFKPTTVLLVPLQQHLQSCKAANSTTMSNPKWLTMNGYECKRMVSAVTEYLNFRHDGINTPMCLLSMLTGSGISMP
jgi:hypothetical protein